MEQNNYGINSRIETLNVNTNETLKLDMVYALFNQHLFQEAKNNIDLIQYYYNTDFSTNGNHLIGELLNSIRNYSLESLDGPMIKGILLKLGKTDAEASSILSNVEKWKRYNKDQITPYRDTMRQILNEAIIKRARSLYGNDPTAYVEYLRNNKITLEASDYLSTVQFDQLDINTIIKTSVGGIVRTGVDWVDGSFGKPGSRFYGVPDHQTVLVCCPPGTGKTMFMMNIALNIATNPNNVDEDGNHYKCHYLAMGDMMPSDFITRMGSIATGFSMETTKTNILQTYHTLGGMLGDRLSLAIVPSARITVDEYIEEMKRSDFKVLFIDYDSNFKNNAGDNMYLEFGMIYDRLTELTQMGKLIFIAAQPKVQSWGAEVIEQDMVGESARKIHSVDMAITGSKATEFGNSGIFKVVKNRRGKSGRQVGYLRMNNGRFRYIDKALFNSLRNTDTTEWTEDEVDNHVYTYESTKNSMAVSSNAAGQSYRSGGASTMKNPF